MTEAPLPLRPATVCRQLLDALEGSEGRRKKRKRNTTPDALGLGVKRDLLEQATVDDPEPDEFDAWLLAQALAAGPLAGATRAMAMDVLAEWQMALASAGFRGWLADGAPSDDAGDGDAVGRTRREDRDGRRPNGRRDRLVDLVGEANPSSPAARGSSPDADPDNPAEAG